MTRSEILDYAYVEPYYGECNECDTTIKEDEGYWVNTKGAVLCDNCHDIVEMETR